MEWRKFELYTVQVSTIPDKLMNEYKSEKYSPKKVAVFFSFIIVIIAVGNIMFAFDNVFLLLAIRSR